MLNLNRNGYTAAEVQAALHSANRRISFRYELLDQNDQPVGIEPEVLNGSIEYGALREIKRTGRFKIKDSGKIDYLRHRLKVYMRLHMPKKPGADGYAEFPLGVFLLSTPPRRDEHGIVVRDVEAYDLGQVLRDDKTERRYTVLSGTNVVQAVADVLLSAGLTKLNLEPTDKTLPSDRDWPPGTPKARIVADLLGSINYASLWFDGEGYAVARPYVAPDKASISYTYADDSLSVVYSEGYEHNLDAFGVANKWVLFVSEPDRPPLLSVRVNDNPGSPTSTVNRGRVIVDYRQVDAVDQESLDGLADRLKIEATQLFEHIRFRTALMPFHEHAEVLHLRYAHLGINGRYVETGWRMDLKAGGVMEHEARRVVIL